MINSNSKFISKSRLLKLLAAGYPYEVLSYKSSYVLVTPPTSEIFRIASTMNDPYLATLCKYCLITSDLHNDILTNYPEYLI